jgi:hypothetical protein
MSEFGRLSEVHDHLDQDFCEPGFCEHQQEIWRCWRQDFIGANTRATLAEARLSDFRSMPDDIREQRDRWQQQADRLAALAITDQRKEPAPAQPQSWRRWLRTPTGDLVFLWLVGLMCGGVLLVTLKVGS